jgi:hypothetical protein
MAEQPQQLQVQLPPSLPPHPATYASVCLVNRLGQTIFLDFGAIDPLMLGNVQPGAAVRATHVGRIVMAEDAARQLRADLGRLLGESS